MRLIRSLLVVAVLTLLMAPQVWANDRPPIRIVNDANHTWSVKVWAYRGTATNWEYNACQVLDYDVGWARHIESVERRLPGELGEYTHWCGQFDTLTFWFRAWNRETGAYRDYSTFGFPTPWGATWRFDGTNWACTGC